MKRVYRKLSESPNDDFTLSRHCMDVCKEDAMTTCCVTDLCNGALGSARSWSSSSLLLRLMLPLAIALGVYLYCCVCLCVC